MSDAQSGKPKALGRGLDSIVRPPAEDVDATENLLKRVQPRHVRPSTPPSTRPSTPTRGPSHGDVSPRRDFQKVPNSVTRDALPAGMFNGKAKHLYDCLYSLTRGAIVPRMSVRIARADLMKQSGIGAKVTLEQNLRRLTAVGLVAYKTIGGIQGGNEYTVYTPDEATPPSTGTSQPSPPSGGQNLGTLAPLETSPPSHGVSVDFQRASGESKTSFKTEGTDDDEAMPTLRARAGRLPKTEAVLISLLDTLEARTDVASPDALLAHVLRRKLAPRGNTAQRRPNEEQFRGGESRIEVTAEDLEEYERNRAKLLPD